MEIGVEKIVEIEIDKIIPHPGNRRVGGFDPKKLADLAESIKAVGVLQPVIVREKAICEPATCTHMTGRDASCEVDCCRKCKERDTCNSGCANAELPGKIYELIAGERRWWASKLAGLTTVPCAVRVLDDLTVLKIHMIENLQREDVHPLDDPDGYFRLMDEAKYDAGLLAQEVGKSVSYVYQRLKLLDLIEPARKLLVDGTITAGHAILIARLAPDQQKEVVKEGLSRFRGDVLSVHDLDEWIHRCILMDLSRVTWKKDDAELLPAAGSCQACPKRAGFHPDLFADVCTTGKKDYCTDRKCFAAKAQAMVERRRAELQGTDCIEVCDAYLGYGQDLPKDALDVYGWEEVKQKDKGAVRVLVVAGDNPGRLTWGKKRKENRSGTFEKTEKQKTEEKKKRETAKKTVALRELLYRKTCEAALAELQQAENSLTEKTAAIKKILGFVVPCVWDRCNYDDQFMVAKHDGWVEKRAEFQRDSEDRITPLSLDEMLVLLVKLAIAGDLKISEWEVIREKAGNSIKKAAELYGIDVKAAAGMDSPGGASSKKEAS